MAGGIGLRPERLSVPSPFSGSSHYARLVERAAASNIARDAPRVGPIRFVSGGVQGGTTTATAQTHGLDNDSESEILEAEAEGLEARYSEDEAAARDLGLM